MTVASLPTMGIKCGQVFRATITLTDNEGTAIDLSTGWTGRFAIATSYTATAALDVAPSGMTSAGVITLSLSAVQTLTLQSLIAAPCVKCQVDLDKNDGSDAHRMQGDVKLYTEIPA